MSRVSRAWTTSRWRRLPAAIRRACSASIFDPPARSMCRCRRLVARLLEGVRVLESRQRKAALGKLRHDRERREIELQKMCTNHLAGDADVGQTRIGAERKRRRGAACE